MLLLSCLLLSCAGDGAAGGDGGVDAAVDASLDRGARDASSDRAAREASAGDAPRPDASAVDRGVDSPLPLDFPPGSEAASCAPVVAKPSPDPWSVRHPSAGFGGLLTKQSGPHTDVFLKSPTDLVRVGARLNWGGTVVFFGLSANPNSNVIDANDPGRELQVAIYDVDRIRQGCAHDASCKSNPINCGNSITFLGWNPVQGGDECGHGAPVLSHGKQGDALRLVVQPLQWNPDWAAPDCRKSSCGAQGVPVGVTYTFELRFVREHVVEVMTQVQSNETLDHAPTGQELPTLYVSNGKAGPDLPLLLDAAGKAINITTPANDGFFHDAFTSPAPWVSWQNATKTYGVALAMDQGITLWDGWRGDGVTGPYFHNVRARMVFGLPPKGLVRGLSYLALGSFATVKAELQAVQAKRPPFGWVDDPPYAATTTVKAGQPLSIGGWVLDTAKVASVRVEIDGQKVKELAVGGSRPDVCKVYPEYAGCPKVGFSGSVATAGLGPCPRLLRVVARDQDGNETVLGERRVLAQ